MEMREKIKWRIKRGIGLNLSLVTGMTIGTVLGECVKGAFSPVEVIVSAALWLGLGIVFTISGFFDPWFDDC
jgi:hypothetical protein